MLRILIGILILSASLFLGSEALSKAGATHVIQIDSMVFNPARLEAQVGDVIEWKNGDLVPHTVTSDQKNFDSGTILQNKSWKMTVKRSGIFSYHCDLHPTMKAELVVGKRFEKN
jgi:plastocyanin